MDATNAPGLYVFDLTQAETNADKLVFSGKSATANVKVIPVTVYTRPASFSSLVIANGCVDADVERFAGTAGTFASGRPEVSNVSGNVSGSVASVTGNVGGNVTGSVGSVASGGISRASFAAETGLQTVRSNTAQAGASGTITLDASASATTDFYAGAWVSLTGGTGVGQIRLITAYNGTSKVATIAPNWATAPDNTSTFAVISAAHLAGVQGNVTGSVASVTGGVTVTTNNDKTGYRLSATGVDDVWDEAQSGHTTAGTFGRYLDAQVANVEADTQDIQGRLPAALTGGGNIKADILAINGVTASAANLEKSASVIYRGTVTGASPTTTTLVDSGLTQSSTDHWKGRILIFTSGTLTYQATDITGFTPATDTLTFTALTNAPAQNDTYVIV